MGGDVTGWFLFAAAFLACTVEAVEATTVVMAVGLTRGWRSPLRGALAAIGVLAVIVAALGPALTVIPIGVLRMVVGSLLLIFGLGWLRKAILRASGYKALHDEDEIFARQRAAAESASPGDSGSFHGGDPYSFTLSFKAVLLEGLEVAFIVITFGANANAIPLASVAAAAAIAVTVLVALIVRGPLSRVPENTIKFVVGMLLTSFGTFWSAEGAGAHWPGSDASLLAIVPFVAAVSLLLVGQLRYRYRTSSGGSARAVLP